MKKAILAAGCVGLLLTASNVFAQAKKAEPKGDAKKGAEVFDQCAVCHNTDSEEKKVGPGLKGLFKHATLKNGKKVTDENVKAVINTGGNGMPSYADMVSDTERTDLMAYLHTL